MVTHQLQVERRTGKVRRPETDVLPLCHATNLTLQVHGDNPPAAAEEEEEEEEEEAKRQNFGRLGIALKCL